jgi:hypothetical protein
MPKNNKDDEISDFHKQEGYMTTVIGSVKITLPKKK